MQIEFFLPLAICPESTKSTKRLYFLVIVTGVHQAFGVEKILLCFVCCRLRKLYIFFVLSPPPHSFCAGAAPAYSN